MSRTRRHFTAQQKADVVRRHLADKVPVSDLADELGVQVIRGKEQDIEPRGGLPGKSRSRTRNDDPCDPITETCHGMYLSLVGRDGDGGFDPVAQGVPVRWTPSFSFFGATQILRPAGKSVICVTPLSSFVTIRATAQFIPAFFGNDPCEQEHVARPMDSLSNST